MRIIGREVQRRAVLDYPTIHFDMHKSGVAITAQSMDQLGWTAADKVVIGMSDDGHEVFISRSNDNRAFEFRKNSKGQHAFYSSVLHKQVAKAFGVAKDAKSFRVRMEETNKLNGPYIWHQLHLVYVNS